jgi:hypothetical protein
VFIQPKSGRHLIHLQHFLTHQLNCALRAPTHCVWDHLELHVGIVVSNRRVHRRGANVSLQQVIKHNLVAVVIKARDCMRNGVSENEDGVANNGRAALLFLPGVMGFSVPEGWSGSDSSWSPPCVEPGPFLSRASLCDIEGPDKFSDDDLE